MVWVDVLEGVGEVGKYYEWVGVGVIEVVVGLLVVEYVVVEVYM